MNTENEGLKQGDAVECGPAMRAAIIELARVSGLHTSDGVSGGIILFLSETIFDVSKNSINGGRARNYIVPEAFIAKMRVTASQPKPIKIGDHAVKFNKGSIQVGCTTVDNATVRAIAEKLQD